MRHIRYPFAVFYITPPGESGCEGLYVARDAADAVKQFVEECGSDEYEWEAHQLSSWNSKAWCEGYLESMNDAEERAEEAAARKRMKGE